MTKQELQARQTELREESKAIFAKLDAANPLLDTIDLILTPFLINDGMITFVAYPPAPTIKHVSSSVLEIIFFTVVV